MKQAMKILSHFMDELETRVDNDIESILASPWRTEWRQYRLEKVIPAKEEEKEEKRSRLRSLMKEDENPAPEGYKKVLEKSLELSLGTDEMMKICAISVEATYNNSEVSTSIDLRWWDHYRPTIIRAKRLVSKAYYKRKDLDMTKVDKQLATINSSRIDDILFGDDDDKKEN